MLETVKRLSLWKTLSQNYYISSFQVLLQTQDETNMLSKQMKVQNEKKV
jgi:hypothetical protein